jgi:hypothetical protein
MDDEDLLADRSAPRSSPPQAQVTSYALTARGSCDKGLILIEKGLRLERFRNGLNFMEGTKFF